MKWQCQLWSYLVVSIKVKHASAWSSDPGSILRQHVCSHRDSHSDAQNRSSQNCQELGKVKSTAASEWVNKGHYQILLFNSEKEWIATPASHVHELQRYHVEMEQVCTKGVLWPTLLSVAAMNASATQGGMVYLILDLHRGKSGKNSRQELKQRL